MALPLMALGSLIGGIGSLAKTGMGFAQAGMANKINPQWSEYNANPLAAQNLGIVKNLYYGKSPAFSQAEANIRQAQAGQMAAAQRNAPDAATLLAIGAGTQGMTQSNLSNLGAQEAQSKAGVLDNLSRAYAMSIAEGDKVQANKLAKYQLDAQQKSALLESGISNIFGGISDIGGGLTQYGSFKSAQKNNQDLLAALGKMTK